MVSYIESVRKRLSPETRTYVDEIGIILPDARAPKLVKPIPDSYWNLYAAWWAYVYSHLAKLGIDVAAESQLVGYPGMYAGTTILNWETGQPKANYWALMLMRENLGSGCKLVETSLGIPYVYAQAFLARDGQRKILLINKRDRSFKISIPGGTGAQVTTVDRTTGSKPPETKQLNDNELTLGGFAVTIITFRRPAH